MSLVDPIYLDNITCHIRQPADCCQDTEMDQLMKIEFPDNGVDHFIRITTEENGWAFNDVDDFKSFCDKVIARYFKSLGEDINS